MMMWLVYGACLSQLATYIANYTPKRRGWSDPALLVGFIMVLATTDLGFLTNQAWSRFIIDREAPVHKVTPPSTVTGVGILHGIIGCAVMLFFARKVWVLGCSLRRPVMKLPGILICFFAIAHLFAAIATVIISKLFRHNFSATQMGIVVGVNLGTALIADILITVSMISLLAHYRRASAFSRTKQLLNTITRHTIENGFVTTVCASGNMIVYYACKNSMHEAFRYPTFALYTLVLLTSLNRGQAAHMASLDNTSVGMSTSVMGRTGLSARVGTAPGGSAGSDARTEKGGARPAMQVQVVRHVEHASDAYALEGMGADAKDAGRAWEAQAGR